jgi:hypothetical protein
MARPLRCLRAVEVQAGKPPTALTILSMKGGRDLAKPGKSDQVSIQFNDNKQFMTKAGFERIRFSKGLTVQ